MPAHTKMYHCIAVYHSPATIPPADVTGNAAG